MKRYIISSDLKTEYLDAPIGTTVTVDARRPQGHPSFGRGKSYEFRKISEDEWEEIFDDYFNVTSKELAQMQEHYQSKRRWYKQ